MKLGLGLGLLELGKLGGKLPDLREEVRVRAGNVGIRKGITNRGNGDCLGNVSVTVENSVDLGEEIRDSMPKKVRVVEERNVEDVKGKVGRRMKTRMTRSLRKEVEEFVSLEMAVRRTRSAKIVEDVTVREAEEGSKVDREAGNVGVVERITETGGKVKSYLASEYQLPEESASGEIPEETGTEYHDDLEKMTVGEWFEYLEAYLPKQIYNVTYEIIDDMRKRAKQFDDFMLSNSNRKRNANCL
ncbi:hypothetical protein RND81_11G034300 [Saponaria officinalis]|uniref:Uncharacterized protein n=1 Tax=Saponaria officinalis TaxID=3572 RepID=A0AAW1HHV9_SAPOF